MSSESGIESPTMPASLGIALFHTLRRYLRSWLRPLTRLEAAQEPEETGREPFRTSPRGFL